MIDKKNAIEIQAHALAAIEKLTAILDVDMSCGSSGIGEKLKEGVGISIGTIQMDILEVLNSMYPELDDL